MAYTVSGRECIKWSNSKLLQEDIKREKEEKSYRRYNNKEKQSYGNQSVCRYPGRQTNYPGSVWCYTSDPVVPWEECLVPSCKPEALLSITVSLQVECSLASHLFQGSKNLVIHKKVKVLDKKNYFLAQVKPNKFPILF